MAKEIIEDQQFSGIVYTEDTFKPADYENCRFTSCQLAGINLSHVNFMDCVFENCDLSMAKLGNTGFKGVALKGCKLLGLHFEDVNPFLLELSFADCQLNLSSFFNLTLKKTRFSNCGLKEVDFSGCDLTQAVFHNCDMLGAAFGDTVLEKADLRTAFNYSIDPERNKLKKAKFSLTGLPGLLQKHDIDVG
jgi:fluoroquinolone resistance protein